MQKGTDCLPSWSQDYLYSICSHRLSREKRKCFTVNSFNRNISRTRGEKSVSTQFPRLHSLWESKWRPQWSELYKRGSEVQLSWQLSSDLKREGWEFSAVQASWTQTSAETEENQGDNGEAAPDQNQGKDNWFPAHHGKTCQQSAKRE